MAKKKGVFQAERKNSSSPDKHIKLQKSVLRYPGGKTRAVNHILKLIPENTKEIVSPFFGGGSIELALASKGIRVYGYDVFNQLVIFWKELLKSPTALAKEVEKYRPLSKSQFYELQKLLITEKEPLRIASIFFVLNRSSFSGSTLSGGMSPQHLRFNQSSIERLRSFSIKNLFIQKLDFKKSLVV